MSDVSRLHRFVAFPGQLHRVHDKQGPRTVRGLLRELGVEDATREQRRAAVKRWLDDGNSPDRVLHAGLDRQSLLPKGADAGAPVRR